LIEDIKALAQTAGREIKKIYEGTDWSVTIKADDSPLTQADLRANEIIATGLAKLSKELVISEEGDTTLFENAPARFWLVDPLDGTRDFVAKLDTFVVCIALIENNEPILGVIYSPVTDETWWAEKGAGAFGPSGRITNTRQGTTNLIAVGSRSTASDRMQLLYDKFSVTRVERFGSALKFCKIAEGHYDVYPRFGPMMEWDTAAGQVIAEEAGCKVIDVTTGQRLRYGKPGLKNRGFICSRSNLTLETQLAEFVRK
jgi:3'(2'), 5'-bisphosphate nucleotidase